MGQEDVVQTERAVENGGWRHPWPWFLARGLGFCALGFGLGGVGGWRNTVWLEVIGFGLGTIGMWMLVIAWGEARRGRGAAWWRWYHTAYERNVRAAEHGRDTESDPPQRPNDR